MADPLLVGPIDPSSPSRRSGPAGSTRSRLLILLACFLCGTALTGCRQLGARKLRSNRVSYNQALRYTEDEQLLLNLVRLRYREPVNFLAVGGISSQFHIDADLEGRFNIQAEDPKKPGFRSALTYSERPTITYSPLEGQEFMRRLLTPLDLESIQFLAGSEWSLYRVLMLMAKKINGVDNATHAGIATPPYRPRFETFKRIARLFRELQKSDTIELTFEKKLEPVPSAVVHERIDPEVALDAEERGYGFLPGPGGKGFVLARHKLDSILRIKPDEVGSKPLAELARLLGVEPGLKSYDLEIALEGQLKPRGRTGGRAVIWITPRSLMGTLFYLSQTIEIPEEHYASGLVMEVPDDDGGRFDWNEVSGEIFKVHSSTRRPTDARFSVQYRGHWYFIKDDDVSSKTTFALVSELFDLTISAGGARQLPVLTLSAG